MQYFYVTKDTTLKLPHKEQRLLAPSQQAIICNQIPVDNIHCGFIAWEAIQAEELLGKEHVFKIEEDRIPLSALPLRIKSYDVAGSISDQLTPLSKLKDKNQPIKIALINGTGTMLGDTIVGASVIEHVCNYLKTNGVDLSVDVYAAWNARPGVEEIWQKIPCINHVYGSSPTIKNLQSYDAYWDFSNLLQLSGYDSQHFGDCYLNHFGLDPECMPIHAKLPHFRVHQLSLSETKERILKFANGRPTIFLQANASTPARSMPESFVIRLIKWIVKEGKYRIVLSDNLPAKLSNYERSQILNLRDFTHNNLDRYLSAIMACDEIITVDTLALHIAMACGTPGKAYFSLSKPDVRLKYSPEIKGILIPNAESLPYWNKHKADRFWAQNCLLYVNAWESTET